MVDREIIRTIQLSGLESLHKFDHICKKYNIQYFAIYGTLLGAVRHQGYIPWDDDLDLGIFREDYEKLEKIPAEEWGEELELVSPVSAETKHDKFFPRVYLKNSKIQSYQDVRDWKDPKTNESWYTSLMIDLYIYDHIPDDDEKVHQIREMFKKYKNRYKILKLKANLKFKFDKRSIKNFGRWIYGNAGRLIFKDPWKRLYNKAVNIVKTSSPGERISTYYSVLDQTCFEKEDIFPLQEVDFEDMKIRIPRNYSKFLEIAYGKTYMQFPPENERYHINFIYADLGNGTVFNVDPISGSLGAK